jgi:hypothetical protein
MEDFVFENSIVRKIWGKADVILFIFAGAAAEFALNKAVDWLYFTGKLPADPLARLFSTVAYARKIVFSTEKEANASIDQITMIHKQVEDSRSAKIPDWAYRDVLFMLIDYSIRAFEMLERKLSAAEQSEVFYTFYKVGLRMNLAGLPVTFDSWVEMREDHLSKNLIYSTFSEDLFEQYRKHLGIGRYLLMRNVQSLLVPARVKNLLHLKSGNILSPLLWIYKLLKLFKLQATFRDLLIPVAYKAQVQGFDLSD